MVLHTSKNTLSTEQEKASAAVGHRCSLQLQPSEWAQRAGQSAWPEGITVWNDASRLLQQERLSGTTLSVHNDQPTADAALTRMFIGTTRDGMATPVKLTKLCLICYGIFHLAVVICADTSSSLGTTTTTAQNPLTVVSLQRLLLVASTAGLLDTICLLRLSFNAYQCNVSHHDVGL